jgi:Protein of unknown function (DUF3558)
VAGVRRGLVFGLAALALAACSAGPDANPATATNPPPVKLDDLDLKPYVGLPCRLLDGNPMADLRVTRRIDGASTDSNVGSCYLNIGEMDWSVTLEVATDAPDPADDAARIKIAGYPAVETKDDSTCEVHVRVGGPQQLSTLAHGPEACHLAENVAPSAIGTIKQRSP